MAQPIQLAVHIGILFNISIRGRDIGFRLIIIVIADEKLHRVVGEKLPKFRAKLGGQRFIVGQHQGRSLHLLDDIGHSEGFARAGDAQQRLLRQAQLHSLGQFGDSLRLVAGGFIIADNLKFRHDAASAPS